MRILSTRGCRSGSAHAIWAYLNSIPVVTNHVPEYKVSPEAIAQLNATAEKMEAMMKAAPAKSAEGRRP